jgi:hypothetical protein
MFKCPRLFTGNVQKHLSLPACIHVDEVRLKVHREGDLGMSVLLSCVATETLLLLRRRSAAGR